MSTEKEIERCLRTAPKPAASEGLLDRLQENVSVKEVETRGTVVRRWFAPAGGSISLWRVAAAAMIGIFVTLSLSYGAAKVIKYFVISTAEITFDYPEENVMYGVKRSISVYGDNISSEEDATKRLQEFKKLYKEGKAKEVEPGIWVATLSDGTRFGFGIWHPEQDSIEFTEEEKELLKKEFDEIHKLRKAGRFEKTYKPEHDFVVNGVKYRYFEARYTLSNGKVVTTGDSEPVRDEDKQ